MVSGKSAIVVATTDGRSVELLSYYTLTVDGEIDR